MRLLDHSERFGTPEDHDAVRAVIAAYAVGLDRQDREILAPLFAPGCVIEVHWPTGYEHGMTMPEGVGALTGLSQFDYTFHDTGPPWIRFDEEGARAVTYCTAHHVTDRVDALCGVRYEDTLVRSADGWQFTRRDETIVWTDSRTLQEHTLGQDPARP